MIKTNIKLITRQVVYALVGVTTMLAYFPSVASAAQITSRSVEIGNSVAGATTTYDFAFTTVQDNVRSITFEACTNASGASCTSEATFDGASALLDGTTGLGATGTWTDASTASELRITNATAVNTAGAVTVDFSVVDNPTNAGTFYIWITTYSDAAYTNALDTGAVATSTASNVTVTANVDETLTFTVGSTTVDMTPGLTSTSTGTGISTIAIGTNGSAGYTLNYTGTTLTSGGNTINAIGATKATAAQGSEQFGINLMDNSAPNVGATKTGTGTIETNYATANDFAFVAGTTPTQIAHNTAPADDEYTVSYIANIAASQAPGAYTASINYVATANF